MLFVTSAFSQLEYTVFMNNAAIRSVMMSICLTSIHAKWQQEVWWNIYQKSASLLFKASISFRLARMRILRHAWLTCCLFIPRSLNGDSCVPQDALKDTRDWVTLIQHSISQQNRKRKSTKSFIYIPELGSCQLPFGGRIYAYVCVRFYLFSRKGLDSHRLSELTECVGSYFGRANGWKVNFSVKVFFNFYFFMILLPFIMDLEDMSFD